MLTLIEDAPALRNKLRNARFPLDGYWQNFLDLAATEPIGEFQSLPPLAWLVTGDRRFARNTRTVMLELLETLPLADASEEAQFHAYTMGAPVARFAVFLDWIWDCSILSSAEKKELAARMVEQVYTHCYLRLRGRVPAGDNQQGSMAFACAVTGYVFGVKRGASAAAQRLFMEGTRRFRIVLEHLGEGGWSGEGSTYHHQVLSPILAIYTAFMEQIIGKRLATRRFGAASVKETLQMAASTINTASMLPGWDEYGNCAPELKTHLAYLARITGDAAPLGEIVRHGMWSENELLAWYTDDKVWTLIFWPDEQPELQVKPPRSWLNKPVAARLIGGAASLDLLQMWDHVQGGRPGRAHLNPNNIEFCSFGTLHTCDGHGPAADPDFFEVRDGHNFAAAHSLILVDHEFYRFLDDDFNGLGSGPVDLPSLKAVRGDVSDYYRKIWGIASMKRASLLLGDRLALVVDHFESAAPHTYTWQMMLRPDVSVDGARARQRLREGTILELATSEDQSFQLTPIRDYPRGMEQRTQRLWLEFDRDGDGSVAVVMRPQAGRKTVADLSARWSVTGGGETMPANLFELPETTALDTEYLGPTMPEETIWFGKKQLLSATEAAAAQRLSIRRAQVDRLEVWVNGEPAEPLFDNPGIQPGCRDVNKPDGPFWESHFNVAGLLQAGENRIAIASSEFRGQVISGPILLLCLEAADQQELNLRDAGDWLEITDGEELWMVVPDNETQQRISLPGEIKTDAERVAVTAGILALGGVRFCAAPDFSLTVETAIDLERRDDILTIDPNGDAPLCGSLTVKGQTLDLAELDTATADFPVKICVVRKFSPWANQPFPGYPEDLIVPSMPAPDAERRCVYDWGWPLDLTENAERDALQAALQADNWRIQVAAVERIGIVGHHWAVAELIRLFEEEEKAELYPTLHANWPFSKMKTTFFRWVGQEDLQDQARLRRYRLKLVILEALGRLGAAEAAPLVLRTLQQNTDFYPAIVQACVAAGRLRLKEALPLLDAMHAYPEINARRTAGLAAALIRGEIQEEHFNAGIPLFPGTEVLE